VNRPLLRIVNPDGSITAPERASQQSSAITLREEEPVSSGQRLETEDIYPDPGARPAFLNSALKLLHEATTLLDKAIADYRAEDRISADDCICQFQALLPELFACFEIGEGFALIVSSMFHALQNAGGLPLNERQMIALAYLVRFARTDTYCSIDTAIDALEKLTEADLNINPPMLDLIAERIDA
jgi:hypothetical protein